ncbi:MAG: hypothetical protein COA80_16205 [Leeuwenhoekiella sp.]|nr:MAG: hypothetical protein COA80_16205 [Leeuwenhoekiella sp.]
MIGFELRGTDAAVAAIRNIRAKVTDDTVRPIALAALEPVAEEARVLVPVRSGNLRSDIAVSPTLPNGEDAGYHGRAVFVGTFGSDDWYAWDVEMGGVNRRANPFLVPAVETKAPMVFDLLGEGVGRLILGAV